MNIADFPLILAADQHELGLTESIDRPIDWTRLAARVVMTDDENRVAVMHFTELDSYKLPGGGIDEGESIEAALHREVQEETGYKISDDEILGRIEEDRYYCGMHQTSYCFTARTADFTGTSLTEKEAKAGMELVWASGIDEAIQLIQSGASIVDEDGSTIGSVMMKLRDTAILRAAKEN